MLQKEAYSYRMVFNDSTAGTSKKRMSNTGISKSILLLFFSFLIGRVVFFGEVAPFGVALFASLLSSALNPVALFLSISAGILSYQFSIGAFKYITAMILLFFYGQAVGLKQGKWTRLKAAIGSFISIFIINMIFCYPNGLLTYDIILSILESSMGFVMVYVFGRVADLIFKNRKRRILSSEEIISISIFLSLIVVGFWDVKIFNASFRNIFAMFWVLFFAYVGGPGTGTSMGITIGLILSMASTPDALLIGSMGICGLMAGLFNELGKGASAGAFILANALMTFYINKSTYSIIPFTEIAAAGIILMIIPNKGVEFMQQFLDASISKKREQNDYIKRMQEIIVRRLSEFSQVFNEMSRAFGKIPKGKIAIGQQEISELFNIVASDVCSNCALNRSCWERDFYNTYGYLFELLTKAESDGYVVQKDIPDELKRRCINKRQLVDEINKVYAVYASNLKWQTRLDESRELVAEQLSGVSKVITQLAAEIDIHMKFKKELEDSIQLELDKNGIYIQDVLVLEKNNGNIEVSITKKPCNGRLECTRVIEKKVSDIIGKPMTGREKGCTYCGKGECSLTFVETEQFKVVTGITRRTKEFKNVSGDSYSFSDLNDGKYMLALSDGMGSGHRAAIESSAVITLLENFLEVGFDLGTTIRTINSILLLRSKEEMFATADLCIIDLITGKANFIKIGAVATFIKRANNSVEVIKSSTLPIGILDQVDVENVNIALNDDDMIIMLTDGILDSGQDDQDKENWIIRTIYECDTKNPQELADYIMEKALERNERQVLDDMTVMVSRVWEPL